MGAALVSRRRKEWALRMSIVVRAICVVAGAFYVGFGAWAFLSPHSFFDQIAHYPPFNKHLFHDLGAFQIGLGVTLFAALRWRDALTVALVGVAVGSAFHALAHWMDRDLGGKASDPWLITLLGAAIVYAAVRRGRGNEA
jgi:purine-cytosine permease-like protein